MHAVAVLDALDVAAGRVGERRQHLGGRGDLGELARIGGPDIDQRGELPSVARHSPSSFASMVERQTPGSAGASVRVRVLPDGVVSVTSLTVSAMVWRCTVRSRPRTNRRSASSSRSGCFISQCESRRSRSICGPPPS